MSAVTVTGRLSAPASASSALASALAWKEDPRPRPRPPESWWFEPPAVEEEVSAELVSALPDRITSRPDFQNLVRRDEASVLRALRRAPDARNDGDICALRCWSDGMAWLADLSLRARVALIRAALLHSVEIETAICTLQYRAPAIYVIVRGQVYIRDQFGRCMGILRSGDVFGDIAAVRHVSLDRSQIYTCVAAGHVDLALLRRAEVRCGFRDAVNKKIEDNFVLLSRTSGLKSLSTPRLRQLAELAVLKRFPRGAVLVKEHDLVDYLSIVTRGTCRKLKRFNATRSGPVVYELALGAVGPGEVLGAKCVTDAAASHDITCVVTSAECDVLQIDVGELRDSLDAKCLAAIGERFGVNAAHNMDYRALFESERVLQAVKTQMLADVRDAKTRRICAINGLAVPVHMPALADATAAASHCAPRRLVRVVVAPSGAAVAARLGGPRPQSAAPAASPSRKPRVSSAPARS